MTLDETPMLTHFIAVVSYDLRSPSMLHGKKGFDRLLYACKKTLNHSRTWLFSDVDKSSMLSVPTSLANLTRNQAPNPDPLDKHFPTKFTSSPGFEKDIETSQVPLAVSSRILAEGDRPELETFSTEIYEWLSLIRLGSPRVEANDDVDSYLSRYRAPQDADGRMKVCKVSWQGFITTQWLREVLVNLLTKCPSQSWWSISATEFAKNIPSSNSELVLLRPPNVTGEYLMWEIRNQE